MIVSFNELTDKEKNQIAIQRAEGKLNNSNNNNSEVVMMVENHNTVDNTFYPFYVPKVEYQNINNSTDLKNKITNHFYKKVNNNWIDSYVDKLKHNFKVSKNGVEITKTPSRKKHSMQNIESIIDHVSYYYLHKKIIAKILSQIHFTKDMNWYEMRSSSDYIKRYIFKKLRKVIELQRNEY